MLLLTYSIQYSSSIKVVSISSSASLSNETSLSTSLWVVVIWPSPLSSSKLHISLMSISSFLFRSQYLVSQSFCLSFFVWMMSRSILRCVDWIILSCSLLDYTVASNTRRQCLSMLFFDVNSSLYLWNVTHGALIRLLITVVSCRLNEISDLNISRFHFLSIFRFSCHQLQVWCVRVDGALVDENFRLIKMTPTSTFFNTFLESTQHFPKLFFGCCEQQHVVGESQVCEANRGRGRSGIYPFFFLLPSLNFILQ